MTPRSVDSPFARYSILSQHASGLQVGDALGWMMDLANQTEDAFVLARAAGMATDAGQHVDAELLIAKLERIDQCSAQIERLWLDYRTGRSTAVPVDEVVQEAFGRLDVIGDGPGQAASECGRLCLALGKLLDHSGYLEEARRWLLGASSLFRQAWEVQSLAASLGALAEVLYRGGTPLRALELLMVDEALLEPGSSDRDRLMVYRAHCLRELGEIESARNLYMEARAVARLRGMQDSPWAARGLAWCLIRESSDQMDPIDIREMMALSEACSAEAHCRAMGQLALSWLRRREGDHEDARRCLDAASQDLAKIGCQVEASLAHGGLTSLSELDWRGVACPVHIDACDSAIASEPLTSRIETVRRAAAALSSGTRAADLTAAFF
jgi:tetratricopeptide (TPR) repeat protein